MDIIKLRQKFSVSQCRKISWASLQCFRNFWGNKKFMHNRGYHVFPSIFFVSQYQKFCWGTLWCIRKFRLTKNFMHQRGASIKFVRRKHFATQYRKFSLGNTSVYQKASGIENFYASERGGGGNTFSVKNFLSHITEKICW